MRSLLVCNLEQLVVRQRGRWVEPGILHTPSFIASLEYTTPLAEYHPVAWIVYVATPSASMYTSKGIRPLPFGSP